MHHTVSGQGCQEVKNAPESFMWEFPKMGVPYLGVLIIRILLFRVLY